MTITILQRLNRAKNAWLVRHTPKRVLDKFGHGLYLDALDARNGTRHKRGYLSWPHTRRLVERCLDCGFYMKSHQDLNAEPLSRTYLETYNILTSR